MLRRIKAVAAKQQINTIALLGYNLRLALAEQGRSAKEKGEENYKCPQGFYVLGLTISYEWIG